MDDRCHYCSGRGTVPAAGTGDMGRDTCPKCNGVGRPSRVVMVGSESLVEALARLRRLQGDEIRTAVMDTFTIPRPPPAEVERLRAELGDTFQRLTASNRQQKRQQARGKR